MNLLGIARSYFRSRNIMHRFQSGSELSNWHDERVISQLKWARSASPYYEMLFYGMNNREWRHFPISDKRVMAEDFDSSNTSGLKASDILPLATNAERSRDFSCRLKGYSIGLSSGTSGKRSIFISSHNENDFWAGALLARILRSPLSSLRRIGFYHRANSTLYSHLNIGLIQVRFFDLLTDIPTLLDQTNLYQPKMLVGPPAMLRALAEAQKSGRIDISPARIFSIAEQLDELDKRYVEQVFNFKLDQLYIATEGFIAASCQFGQLHLCEDQMVVQEEPIPGDPSRFIPILTDFNRRTQPIIRYRLNDVLIRSKQVCPCGSIFRIIERIEGRCDDQLVLKSKSAGATDILVFPDFIRSAIISDSSIEAFHVRQTAIDRLEIHLQTRNDLQASARQSVTRQLYHLFGTLNVMFPVIEYFDYRISFAQGKLRRVERAFKYPPL